jgi:hypothetical protein
MHHIQQVVCEVLSGELGHQWRIPFTLWHCTAHPVMGQRLRVRDHLHRYQQKCDILVTDICLYPIYHSSFIKPLCYRTRHNLSNFKALDTGMVGSV